MSTVPAVLAALASLGQTTLPNSQVINGPRDSRTTTGSRILLIGGDGSEAITSGPTAEMSISTMDETYTVNLTVSASVPSTDQTAADALADADYTAMKLAVRDYPGSTLGLSSGVLRIMPTDFFSWRRVATENERNTAIDFSVAVYVHRT